jgi:hypothetical protein
MVLLLLLLASCCCNFCDCHKRYSWCCCCFLLLLLVACGHWAQQSGSKYEQWQWCGTYLVVVHLAQHRLRPLPLVGGDDPVEGEGDIAAGHSLRGQQPT